MNLFEVLSTHEDRAEVYSRIYGVVTGVVTNNQDPDGQGRVKIKFPWLIEQDESYWARLASPMAGPDRGMVFIPEVDDEVLVAFDHGDVRCPYILGAFWNGVDTPPTEKNGDDANNLRIIKTRSSHKLIFDDTDGSEKIEIIDSTGNNKITIDSSENKITLEVAGDIELKATDGNIVLDANEIELNATAGIKIEAGSSLDIEASATMNVKGQTVNIN